MSTVPRPHDRPRRPLRLEDSVARSVAESEFRIALTHDLLDELRERRGDRQPIPAARHQS